MIAGASDLVCSISRAAKFSKSTCPTAGPTVTDYGRQSRVRDRVIGDDKERTQEGAHDQPRCYETAFFCSAYVLRTCASSVD